MKEKSTYNISADLDDLLFMLGSALRYGFGRKSYATSIIPKVIIENLSLLNEKWLINFLRDINEYEKNRIAWEYKDDECDYASWMKLKTSLLNEYQKRGFTRSLNYYGIEW